MDLIVGSRAESLDDVAHTLRRPLGSGVPAAAPQLLRVDARAGYARWAKTRRATPTRTTSADAYDLVGRVLEAHGYRWEEISNWAQPGHECRHNHVYWDQDDYVGFGSAAHSHRHGRRFWNVRTPDRYVAMVREGDASPSAAKRASTIATQAFERDSLALRTAEGVPLEAFDSLDEIAHLVVGARRTRDAGAARSPARQPGDSPAQERRSNPVALTRWIRRRPRPRPAREGHRTSPSAADSSSPRPRSTADSARPTTTARWASTCCATSSRPGGARWSRRATDIVGLDAAILGPPAVWAASGHLETFTDPLVDCKKCKERWREDKIDGVCPNCGSTEFTEPRAFNLMFKTQAGPVEGEGATAYLRPETAQGIFTNFANVLWPRVRKQPPFGIAQIGKSFRNEITPQNFVFRTREFEQMEMEYFVPPADADEWYRYWIDDALRLVPRPGHPRRAAPHCTSTPRRTSRTTRAAPPTSSSPTPGAGTNSRASPTAATTT